MKKYILSLSVAGLALYCMGQMFYTPMENTFPLYSTHDESPFAATAFQPLIEKNEGFLLPPAIVSAKENGRRDYIDLYIRKSLFSDEAEENIFMSPASNLGVQTNDDDYLLLIPLTLAMAFGILILALYRRHVVRHKAMIESIIRSKDGLQQQPPPPEQ